MTEKRTTLWLCRMVVLALLGTGLGSCSGGRIGLPPLSVLLFNFAPGFAGVALNAPLELTFSTDVDEGTVTPDSIRIFTTTTTTAEPDPGAPAIGDYVVVGAVVRFLPRIPERADLSDAGLRIGFTYTIQVPAAPAVIEPVRTVEGDPNLVPFTEFFTTLNQTILPAPGDITAEPNLNSLSLFFIDEGIENGTDPCPREDVRDPITGAVIIPGLPPLDRDSPQVIDTDPDEGESGFGTITGIQQGLGTAFVRLDPITIDFSEPVSPWRIRPQNISIRNTNLGGETFDLFFFFRQNRELTRLQITVFDADSAFDQASVPQGRYVLELTQFTDLAGNELVNSGTCVANGTFQLSFSTVSSPSLPTDLRLSFQDDDLEGHVDVGGLKTAVNDPNVFPQHVAPFLGGMATDFVANPSPSRVTSTANWGNIALWTGAELFYDNGFRPNDEDFQVPAALRLRGGTNRAATPIMAPIAGRATGRSDPAGTLDGSRPAAEAGKTDFKLGGTGAGDPVPGAPGPTTATLFTGDLNTGPIVYHFNAFSMTATSGGQTPTLTYRTDSIWPLLIFVEDDAVIVGTVDVGGKPGEFGFNGPNTGGATPRPPGGVGGAGGPGGGRGGAGGAAVLGGNNPEGHNGKTGVVPANVLGQLDQLSEAVAGLGGMVTGGGGHYDFTQMKDTNNDGAPDVIPAHSGGGGGGTFGGGAQGGDFVSTTPGQTDQGVGGQRVGTEDFGFGEPGILATGGGGGGGGSADDDGGGTGALENGFVDNQDDGGGGGGGGGGFVGIAVNGDCTLGELIPGDPMAMPPIPDTFRFAEIRAVGGRGGSTYQDESGNPPSAIGNPIGQGNAGGGGGGGGISIVCGGDLVFLAAELFVQGKRGGNSPNIEAGGRITADAGGNGGGGKIVLSDGDGIDPNELIVNPVFFLGSDSANRDTDQDGNPDITDPLILRDRAEMIGNVSISLQQYGDDQREPLYGRTRLVTEFFDTLSDSVSYDEVRVLSNAPRFAYVAGDPSMSAIQVYLDAAYTAPGGIPDLVNSGEDSEGNLFPGIPLPDGTPTGGASVPVELHRDRDTGQRIPLGEAQYESRFIDISGEPPALALLLGRRFVRVRLVFDLSVVDTPANLLTSFAPPTGANVVIADDPATPDLDNTLGNTDTAPAGVPAVAEIRVRFTP